MQAIIITAMFGLMLSIVASIISMGTSNTEQLTQQRMTETRAFFEKVQSVTMSDITMENMTGNPAGESEVEAFIRNIPNIRQLSTGRYPDPIQDAWGQPIKGIILTRYMPLTATGDSDNVVSVPVTGIVLVSGGRDGIIQTTLPTVTAGTQLSSLYGIAVPTDATGRPLNDDIIFTFDNRTAQQNILENIRARLDRIGAAAVKEFEGRINIARQIKLAAYQAKIAAGQDASLDELDISGDTSLVFLPLNNDTQGLENRSKLGVNEEFTALERILPRGGRLQISAPQPATAADPLVLTITNGAPPTPWGNPAGSLRYSVRVTVKSS